MRRSVKPSPDRLPDCLRHSDDDTPIPTWRRITEAHPTDAERISKIIARTPEPSSAEDVWNSWSGSVRRSVALLLDKIKHEGWLDAIDGIEIDAPNETAATLLRAGVVLCGIALMRVSDLREREVRMDGIELAVRDYIERVLARRSPYPRVSNGHAAH